MVTEWVILIYLVTGDAPPRFYPVYVSTEKYDVDNESGCKIRASEIQEKLKSFGVECVPVHDSK